MHIRQLLFLAFAGTILFTNAACRKNNAPTQNSIVGNWYWMKTTGGLAGITETPASTGKTITLNMYPDSTYKIFTNQVLTTEGTYTVESAVCMHDGATKPVIHFSDGRSWMVESTPNQTLSLAEEVADGFNRIYSRLLVD